MPLASPHAASRLQLMAVLSYDVHRTISSDRPVTREQLDALHEQIAERPAQLLWLTGPPDVCLGSAGGDSALPPSGSERP